MRELHLQLRCTKSLSAKGIESGRSSSNVFICTCLAPQLPTPVPFAFHPSPETLTVEYQRDRIALATAVGDRYQS